VCDCKNGDSGGGREIEEAVVGYLRHHPEAADTLDGIVAWWLPLQRYEIGKTRIETALTHLVDAGILRGDALPGGATLYSLENDARRSHGEH
jgi:hypothetical protein